MDESEDIMSVDSSDSGQSSSVMRPKPKKRSLIERELETSLTARVTSPLVCEGNTSRYGRARRLKTDSDFCDTDKAVANALKPVKLEKSPIRSPPAYKMHAVNSPVRINPQNSPEIKLNNQLDSTYNSNISLGRFGSEEKKKNLSPVKKFPKIYTKQDLIQTKEKDTEGSITLIKNIFSPVTSARKQASNHVDALDRSTEKYPINNTVKQNGHFDTSSVVKTLDFDSKNKKSKNSRDSRVVLSKSELFELEAKCEFQVGDLAWARIGTFPFWPCIVTREPGSDMFVKKKLFGLKERDVIHVTFFGDNGRRSWVLDKFLRPFLGQQEFETTREQFTPEAKKKDPRYYAAFFISDKKQSLWNASVQEAEALMREPKRLRIDIFYDSLEKARMLKVVPRGQKKLVRANSDVSLSESLFDSLFSEEDNKRNDIDRSRSKRNNSFDVSEVVTACLDNMAVKSGMANIQKQSHMDRWLQKAKSSTPEKTSFKVTISVESIDEIKENNVKEVRETKKDSKKKKNFGPRASPIQKPYSFRKSVVDTQSQKETQSIITDKNDSISEIHENNVNVTEDNVKDCIKKEISTNDLVTNKISESESEKIEDSLTNNSDMLQKESLKSSNYDLDLVLNEVDINKNNAHKTNNSNEESTTHKKIKDEVLDDNVLSCDEEPDTVETKKEKVINEHEILPIPNLVESMSKEKLSYESQETVNEPSNREKSSLNTSFDSNITDCEIFLDEKSKKSPVPKLQQSLDTSKDSDVTDCEDLSNVVESKEKVSNESQETVNEPSNREKSSLNTSFDSNITDCEIFLDEKAKQSPVPKLQQSLDTSKDSDVTDCEDLSSDKNLTTQKESREEVETPVISKISSESSNLLIVKYSNDSKIHKTELIEKSIAEKELGKENENAAIPDVSNVSSKALSVKNSSKSGSIETVNNSVAEKESGLNKKSIRTSYKSLSFTNATSNSLTAEDSSSSKIKNIETVDKSAKEKELEIKTTVAPENLNETSTLPTVKKSKDVKIDSSKSECNIVADKELGQEKKDITITGVSNKSTSLLTVKDSKNPKIKCAERDEKSIAKKQLRKEKEHTNKPNNFNKSSSVLSDKDSKNSKYNSSKKGNYNLTVTEEKVSKNIDSKKESDITKKIEVPQIKAKDYVFIIDPTLTSLNIPDRGEKKALKDVKLHTNNIGKRQEKEGIISVPKENEFKLLNGTIASNMFVEQRHDKEKNMDNNVDHKNEKDKVITKSTDVQKLSETQIIKEENEVEYISDDDFDTVSINSAISEISVTENEKLAFKKGIPEELINGFHGNDYINKIKEEPQDLDALSMNSETDNITLKDLKLRCEEKSKLISKTNKTESDTTLKELASENILSDKDIKREIISENEANISIQETKSKDNILPKIGKVILQRIPIDKYLETPLSLRKSKRLHNLRNEKGRELYEIKVNKESVSLKAETEKDALHKDNHNKTKASKKDVTSKVKELPIKDNDVTVPTVSPKKENEDHVNKAHNQEQSDNITKIEDDIISVNSDDSNVSSTKRKLRKDTVSNVIKEDKMQDPEFKIYLELKQDRIIDEHPELTYDEITAYLYKTWLYDQSLKNEVKKIDDIESAELIKTEKSDNIQNKKPKRNRNKKLSLDAKSSSKQTKKITDFLEVTPRERSKRTISQPYYNEEFSDIEDEIQMFEIFRQKPKDKKSVTNNKTPTTETAIVESSETKVKTEIETCKLEPETSTPEKEKEASESKSESIKPEIEASTAKPKDDCADEKVQTSLEEYYDEAELYFEQLTQPKPNVFKGLTREKVCEICEKKSNLVKCKGCNGMFHVDCVKKGYNTADLSAPSRGRKKKKPKGRKPKSSADSTLESEGHSDEKSQDPNASVDLNESVDELESHTIADAENFEAQLEAKMKELFGNTTNEIQYDSYSSDDGLSWSDTEAGKCKIVDIKLKEKREETTEISDFKCRNCQKYDTPICFVCKSAVSPKTKSEIRQRCQVSHCHKYYHLECLDHWPQTQFNGGETSKQDNKVIEPITCPRHVCHTCVCDDPRGCKTRFSGDKLARCVRCPATYHTFTKCLPAGTEILTASHIICPRHYEHKPGKVPYHVNTGWCFICALGGSLICCEYCPTSFHAECLNISPPEGGYMCEDCETGRLPLYGEMVWVKLGHYRWWPGIILHPSQIPSNIMAAKHSLGEFVVRFFGQYDHYWVNRGRVFPFQEGDTGRISSQKSRIDEAFTIAMDHANRAFEILKNIEPNEEETLDIASSLLPPQYVKLKVNKPCGSLCGRRIEIEESSLTQCDCNPDVEDPCGPESHCLNRMLLTECGPSCRAGERCQNRAFERRQYPALVPYRTPHRGWGLKTLEDIKAGQFVIEYVGELIDMEEFQRRMRRKHEMRDENFYFLTLDKERMIDAGPKGNLARFMNHCCEPNCETQKWTVLGDVRVGLFAINDIPANTEVTFNYNLECAGIDKKRCMCGAKRCSGYIGAKPKQDESQSKKPKLAAKRTNKKRKNAEESPSTSKTKTKKPIGRPAKPRELTEIEKDLLIIKNATTLSSDSEASGRLSSADVNVNVNVNGNVSDPEKKPLKRKRVSFSTEDKLIVFDSASPSVKKVKTESESVNDKETVSAVGD